MTDDQLSEVLREIAELRSERDLILAANADHQRMYTDAIAENTRLRAEVEKEAAVVRIRCISHRIEADRVVLRIRTTYPDGSFEESDHEVLRADLGMPPMKDEGPIARIRRRLKRH